MEVTEHCLICCQPGVFTWGQLEHCSHQGEIRCWLQCRLTENTFLCSKIMTELGAQEHWNELECSQSWTLHFESVYKQRTWYLPSGVWDCVHINTSLEGCQARRCLFFCMCKETRLHHGQPGSEIGFSWPRNGFLLASLGAVVVTAI